MNDPSLRNEIHKRFTLNWLIQGASQHAGMTLHHLVRDELDAVDRRLIHLYDLYALINLLQYWQFDGALVMGRPRAFWKRAARSRRHPFHGHALLSRYGGELAEAARQRAVERAKEKGLTLLPLAFSIKTTAVIGQLRWIEMPHRLKLMELARSAASAAWGIPRERLIADLSSSVASTSAFGPIPVPRTVRGVLFRACVCGWGGVIRGVDGNLLVLGMGTNWQLVAKELVKGTAELICLHGLNDLDEQTYRGVMRSADGIHFEPWMLQTGGELWRRLLAVAPADRPMAQVLMHLARLPAKSLEALMLAVLEQPDWARELLARLGAIEADE
jgi:hypothetical protein